MKNIKVNKKFIAALLAVGVLGGGTAYILTHQEAPDTRVENEVGHDDINPILNLAIDDKDFVVLNVGDHDSKGVHFQNKKMRMCNKQDISLGVVLDSDASNQEEIYNDVEYIKGLVRDYKIDFPVYLNIDRIITNDDLDTEEKTKIIKSFLEKCSANGIYVGLNGTDTNLCRLKKYCQISGYDAFLVMDHSEIKYDGTYHVVEDLEGNIHSSKDLAQVISKKELNQSDHFLNDASHVVADDEGITDVALQYDMSVRELLGFNDMKKKDISVGDVLRIPCQMESVKYGEPQFTMLDKPIRGCDMSYAQGTSIDWNKLSKNFEFIILRCSCGQEKDACFDLNVEKCALNNIPIGVYCYNAYSNLNCPDFNSFVKKQEEQADYTISLLENKNIEYPVYLDIEASPSLSDGYLGKEKVQAMLDTWCSKMTDAGYVPGIYCNQSGLQYLQSKVDYDLSDRFQLWVAGGDQYYADKRSIDLSQVVPSKILNSDEDIRMAQSTDSCVNAGAGNHKGHLDICFSSVDYTDKNYEILESDGPVFEIKEFSRVDYGTLVPAAAVGLGGLGVVGLALNYDAKRKRNPKRKRRKR